MHRQVGVGYQVDDECQRAPAVYFAGHRIAQGRHRPVQRHQRIAFCARHRIGNVGTPRHLRAVPACCALPEGIGIVALLVGNGRGFGEAHCAQNAGDMRACPAVDIALGDGGAYPMTQWPPGLGRSARQQGGT